MTRRASLPGADELFRRTEPDVEQETAPDQGISNALQVNPSPNLQVAKEPSSSKGPRHEEKVTFYCTPEELTRIERARLALRAEHRLGSDRGRIVRAALAEVLDEFESRGANSSLVKRLEQS